MAIDFPASPTVGQAFSGYTWDGVAWVGGAAASTVAMRGYLAGLTLSNGAGAALNIAAGVAADSTNAQMMTLAAAISKASGAPFAVGNGAGALDTGTFTASTWYHVHLIRRASDGLTDILTSLSPTAPTLPSGFTLFRRIGSVLSNAGASALVAFRQTGDRFIWDTPAIVGAAPIINPGTAAVTRTAITPLGVITLAIISIVCAASSGNTDSLGGVLLTDLAQPDIAPSANIHSFYSYASMSTGTLGFQLGGLVEVNTNTSSQFRSRCQLSSAVANLYLSSVGWWDSRGRDA